jgi:hypothetical protein
MCACLPTLPVNAARSIRGIRRNDCRCSCVPRDYRQYRVQVIPKATLAVNLRKQKSPARWPGFWVSPLHTQDWQDGDNFAQSLDKVKVCPFLD